MNAAHDIRILENWIWIYSLVEGVFKKSFLESKALSSKSNLQRKNILEKNENKAQFSLVKSQLMVYQNKQLL